MKKKKIIGATGISSLSLGGLGAIIAQFGLCPCVLASVFSFAGIIAVIFSFLSNNKFLFLAIGLILVSLSLVMQKRKKTCKIHKKK